VLKTCLYGEIVSEVTVKKCRANIALKICLKYR